MLPNLSVKRFRVVANDGEDFEHLKTDLSGRLSSLKINLTEFVETRVKGFAGKYATSICQNIF